MYYIESLEAKARALEQAISEAASAAPQVSLDSNQQTEPRNEQEENEDQHDVADDIGSEIDFLSLNAMAEASTLSSHSKAEPFALSHIVKTAMEADNSDPTSSKPLDSSLKIFTSRLSPISSNLVKKLPQETAVEHLEHFFRYVHISYPFLHPSTVLQYYERVVLTESPQTLHQKIQSVLVHMVMAVGISATDDMAQYGSFFANHFFLVASQYLDDIFTIDNVETTQVLLLLALFSLFMVVLEYILS
ncbi:uncharacterized protein PFLUO_LOCUS6228 [Penicillium psychrofluorescens]|uniref:uncharacterized protein n=1 Tax=Penicillium psychrofluorescens TaxID=3158075 RepID=UPI003CCDE7AD